MRKFDDYSCASFSAIAFSTENWQRPENEVQAISDVVKKFNLTYDGDMRITYMGDIAALDDKLADSIEQIEENTRENKGIALNIAFNYGGRADIIHAAKICYDHGEFIEDTFEKHLSSANLPPLDLVVRTGGEMRLSNFMLYESAYAELMFLEKLWPDMEESDVDFILEEFEKRQRKFGK